LNDKLAVKNSQIGSGREISRRWIIHVLAHWFACPSRFIVPDKIGRYLYIIRCLQINNSSSTKVFIRKLICNWYDLNYVNPNRILEQIKLKRILPNQKLLLISQLNYQLKYRKSRSIGMKKIDLQISPQCLFSFDSFKQGFEISFAKRFGSFTLNDFIK
jgi:hypothetical protein